MTDQNQKPDSTPSEKPPDPEVSELKQWLSSTVRLYHLLVADPKDFFKSCIHELLSIKVGIVLLFIGLVVWTTWYFTKGHYGSLLDTTRDRYSETNTFLKGKLSQAIEDKQTVENALQVERNTFNETKRAKDAEIQRLITEKESKEQQLALLHSFPADLLVIRSNLVEIAATEPTNHQRFAFLLNRVESLVTNLATTLERQPSFELYLNGLQVKDTEFVIFPITTNNQVPLTFAIKNSGNVTAKDVKLYFTCPKNCSVIPSQTWERGGAFRSAEEVLVDSDEIVFTSANIGLLLPGDLLWFNPLTLQTTNLVQYYTTAVAIKVGSLNSSTFQMTLWLRFTNSVGGPYIWPPRK